MEILGVFKKFESVYRGSMNLYTHRYRCRIQRLAVSLIQNVVKGYINRRMNHNT